MLRHLARTAVPALRPAQLCLTHQMIKPPASSWAMGNGR